MLTELLAVQIDEPVPVPVLLGTHLVEEGLELEELQGVSGLRALRVAVDVASASLDASAPALDAVTRFDPSSLS